MENLDIELFAGLTFYDSQFNIRSSLETLSKSAEQISEACIISIHYARK